MPMMQTDPGRHIKIVSGHAPVNQAAGTITGTAINRAAPGGILYLGAVLHCHVASPTGTPTSFTVNNELQDSADGSTDWQDLADTALTEIAAAGQGSRSINLIGARAWIRPKPVVAFVGGTTPAAVVSTTIVLTGANQTPVS